MTNGSLRVMCGNPSHTAAIYPRFLVVRLVVKTWFCDITASLSRG